MKVTYLFTSLLLLVATGTAAVIPSEQQDTHAVTLERRVFGPFGPVKLWHSNHSGRQQFRILGPARLIPNMRDVVTGTVNGALIAKSFFAHFITTTDMSDPFMSGFYIRQYALYKESNGPEGGIIGLQFEVRNNSPLMLNQVVTFVQNYFRDNAYVSVTTMNVPDAFAEGGPFKELPIKRDLAKRNVCPDPWDFASMMRPVVNWDPEGALMGIPMCDEIPAGPGKM